MPPLSPGEARRISATTKSSAFTSVTVKRTSWQGRWEKTSTSSSSPTTRVGTSTPSDGYGTPQSTAASASINLRVRKYGRTTGQTNGKISGINATVNVGYGGGKVARFVGQIVITPGSYSAGGDSGSLIVVQKGGNARKPVALLFAGSSSSTIGSPIGAILTRFGVTVDGD